MTDTTTNVAEDQRPERLGQQDGPHDAEAARSDRAGGFDHSGLHGQQVLLDDPADAERRAEREGEDDRVGADPGADHEPGQRLRGGDEDDERDRPEDVHDHVEQPVDHAVRVERPAAGQREAQPDQQAAEAAEQEAERHDVEGLARGFGELGQERDQLVHRGPP